MQMIDSCLRKLLAAIGLIAVATLAQAQTALPNSTANAIKMPAIPEGKETDLKFYAANGGGVVVGRDAFEQMPKAGLVLWLAGNQFFAMDDVIGAFQKHDPAISVGLITLPPGLLLQAIKAGGGIYDAPRMSPAAASGPPTAMAGRVISIPRFLKRPASAPSQAVLCHVARSPVATRTAPPGVVGGDCAQTNRETVGRAVAPAARSKNFRRLMCFPQDQGSHRILPKMAYRGQGVCDPLRCAPGDRWDVGLWHKVTKFCCAA
jgi:hypothetical protein